MYLRDRPLASSSPNRSTRRQHPGTWFGPKEDCIYQNHNSCTKLTLRVRNTCRESIERKWPTRMNWTLTTQRGIDCIFFAQWPWNNCRPGIRGNLFEEKGVGNCLGCKEGTPRKCFGFAKNQPGIRGIPLVQTVVEIYPPDRRCILGWQCLFFFLLHNPHTWTNLLHHFLYPSDSQYTW